MHMHTYIFTQVCTYVCLALEKGTHFATYFSYLDQSTKGCGEELNDLGLEGSRIVYLDRLSFCVVTLFCYFTILDSICLMQFNFAS